MLERLNAALAAIQAINDRYHEHVDPAGALQKATSEASLAAGEVATALSAKVSALEEKLNALTANLAAQANSLHSTVAQLADTAGIVHDQVPVIEPDAPPAEVSTAATGADAEDTAPGATAAAPAG